uniref:Uncharacterized protein n=2 Tax=Picea TaxID=3328 RepID=A0A117NGU3_PICGL|nr:hypothetical protein ABT39_MTgene5513 [Picea glauca]QHR91579.1 hypothetical protein Q903MT_gene5614 [Picea sitchensis]
MRKLYLRMLLSRARSYISSLCLLLRNLLHVSQLIHLLRVSLLDVARLTRPYTLQADRRLKLCILRAPRKPDSTFSLYRRGLYQIQLSPTAA